MKGNWLKNNANKDFFSEYDLDYSNRKADAEEWGPKYVRERLIALYNSKYRAICSIAYLTASRISEVCLLKKRDVRYDAAENLFWFTIKTEKRRDGHRKRIPVNPNNNEEVLFALGFVATYLSKLPENLDPDAYLFGDPGIFQTKRTFEIHKAKNQKEGLPKEYATKIYNDNRMRHRVYNFVMKKAGFNPHLLRHARLSYLAHANKEQYKGHDRMLLIKSLADFTKLESAESYLRDMTDTEKKNVF